MLQDSDVAYLRQSTLFRGMSDTVLRRIADHGLVRRYSPGDVIFNQGDSATEVYIVFEGLVKLSTATAAGNDITVDIFSSGQSFAEALAFEERAYPVSATVIIGARLLAIPSSAIRAELHASPEVTNAILASAYGHLHRLIQQIERLKGDSSLQRTARFILALGEGGAGPIEFPYSKSTIASLIGVKPETLSRNFRKLQDVGVQVDGEIVEITNPKALRELISDI